MPFDEKKLEKKVAAKQADIKDKVEARPFKRKSDATWHAEAQRMLIKAAELNSKAKKVITSGTGNKKAVATFMKGAEILKNRAAALRKKNTKAKK